MNLTTGTTLQNGKYALSSGLGQGDLGITLKAAQTPLNQSVVLKTIKPSPKVPVDFAHLRQRFLEEAQRFAQCQHPGLVRLVELFEESGVPFAVMDYIAGESLADQVQPQHPMPETQAIQHIRQVGSALTVLHRNGLVHQDVKPKNLIHPAGTDFVVLVDYRILHRAALGVSEPPTALSNTGFAAIEQYQPPAKLTPATDIYGLAATLYFLVTGRQPTAANHRSKSPLPSPRKLQPDLSMELEAAILSGMELNPQKRPQTIAAWFSLLPGSTPLTPVQLSNGSEAAPAKVPLAPVTAPTNGKLQSATSPPSSEPQPSSSAEVTRALHSEVQPAAKVASPSQTSRTFTQAVPHRSRLPHAMAVAAVIAASCGLGLGLTLRLSAVSGIGPEIFNTKQTFPPLQDWPLTAEPAITPLAPFPEVLPLQESPPSSPLPRSVAPAPEPSPETSPLPEPSVEASPTTDPAASAIPSPMPEPTPQSNFSTQPAPNPLPSVAPEPSPSSN